MNSRSLGQLCAGQLTLLDSRPWPRGWAMCVIDHEAGAVDVWVRTHPQIPEKNLKHMLCAWCAVCGSLIYEGTMTKALHNKWQHREAWGSMRKETCCLFWCWQRFHFGFSTLAISWLLWLSSSQPSLPSFPLDCFLLPEFLSCLSVLHTFISLTLDPHLWYLCLRLCPGSSRLKCWHLCPSPLHAVELISFVPLSRPSPRSSSIEVFLRPIFCLVSLLY